MACNVSKAPFLRIISARGYAAQASPSYCSCPEIKSVVLPNKMVVASAESKLPISRVSVVFRAGSRNETYDGMGASHMMRVCAGLTTANSTTFAINRTLQQKGMKLSATSDRELITYTLEGTVDMLDSGLDFLQDVATVPTFKPWELTDVAPTLRFQVSKVPKDIRAFELLHRAAFRTGLGNSVNCPKYHIGKLSQETLADFFCNTCTTNRCAVVGVGVDQSVLSGFAQNFEIESGPGKTTSSKYFGNGEIRKDRSSSSAHIAIGGEGGAYSNMKEALAFAILQQAYGAESSTKYGVVNGALGAAVSKTLQNDRFKFSTINASYTDNGLFGFLLSTDGRNAGKAVEAAVKVLKSGSVSSNDFNRGKALLKAKALHIYGCDAGQLLVLGRQAALLGEAKSLENMFSSIDDITESDVKAAAKKVGSSKLSMGAVGNLAHVPYISDLV